MDTDRSRDLARMGRMEQELALLRQMPPLVERTAALIFKYACTFTVNDVAYDDWSGLQSDALRALSALDAFRKERGDG